MELLKSVNLKSLFEKFLPTKSSSEKIHPEKFFESLEEQGAKIVKEIIYPDHYIYNENDLLSLAETANKTKSILVTTKKDFVRIPKSYRPLINTLDGEIVFKKEDIITELLSNVLENYFIEESSK